MAIQVKPIAQIASKWSSRAQAAAPDYKAGVSSTQKDWAGLTAASAESWAGGVTQAVADGRFGKGVTQAGTAKWKSASESKGAQRYGPGVASAQSAYQTGFQPFADVLSSLTLPARGPKGSPQNYQLVQAVGTALHQKKISG